MKNFEKEIEKFLTKNYYVKEHRFFNRFGDFHEWGFEIAELISGVFSYTLEDSKTELTKWAYQNDLTDKNFDSAYERFLESFEVAYGRKKLKTKWSPEMAMDLQAMYGITSAEEQLVRLLSDELSREIDAEILRTMRDEIKTSEDLLGVVKCLGYETTQPMYNPFTFVPEKKFVSNNYNEMINERENNIIWQNWVRTREQDEET
jgi:hypothetical protein